MTFQEIIAKIGKGQKGAKNLNSEEARIAIDFLLAGKASPYQIGAFLIALRIKEESVDELKVFTQASRSYLHPDLHNVNASCDQTLDLPFYAGKKSTFHVGIPASLIMAGTGLKVVLHGDPNPPGRISKSMILNSLGWDFDLPLKDRLDFFKYAGWTYLEVTQIHPSFKRLLDLRVEIGLRSVFHTIARFLNPLNASNQLVGVSHPKSFRKIGDTMKMLGISRGLVIRGLEGESEAGQSGPLDGIFLNEADISTIQLDPSSIGLSPVQRNEIQIGDVPSEAAAVEMILEGSLRGDKRLLALWNASIGLYLSGKFKSLKEAYRAAEESLDSKKAFNILKEIRNHQPLIRRS